MSKKRGPLALIIIDGWGYSAAREGNAIALANTPFYDDLSEKYPQTLLDAHGSRVGLPAGVMGNSEVGHLNIGAGRVVYQVNSELKQRQWSFFFSTQHHWKALLFLFY